MEAAGTSSTTAESSAQGAYSAATTDLNGSVSRRLRSAVRRAKVKPTLHVTLFLLFIIVSVIIILIVVFASWPERSDEEERRRLNLTRIRFKEIPSIHSKPPQPEYFPKTNNNTASNSNELLTFSPEGDGVGDGHDPLSEESSHHRSIFLQDIIEKNRESPPYADFNSRTKNGTYYDTMQNDSTDYSLNASNTSLEEQRKGSVVDVSLEGHFVPKENNSSDESDGFNVNSRLDYSLANPVDAGKENFSLDILDANEEINQSLPSSIMDFTPIASPFDSQKTIQEVSSAFDPFSTQNPEIGEDDVFYGLNNFSSIQPTPSNSENERTTNNNEQLPEIFSAENITVESHESEIPTNLSSLFIWYESSSKAKAPVEKSFNETSSETAHDKPSTTDVSSKSADASPFLGSPSILVLNENKTNSVDGLISTLAISTEKQAKTSDLQSSFPNIEHQWIAKSNNSAIPEQISSVVQSLRVNSTIINNTFYPSTVSLLQEIVNNPLPEASIIVTKPIDGTLRATADRKTDTTSSVTSFTQTIQVSDANDYIIRYILKMESTSAASTTYDLETELPTINNTWNRADQPSAVIVPTETLLFPLLSTVKATFEDETQARDAVSSASFETISIKDDAPSIAKNIILSPSLNKSKSGNNTEWHHWLESKDHHSLLNESGALKLENVTPVRSEQTTHNWAKDLASITSGDATDTSPQVVEFFPEHFPEVNSNFKDVGSSTDPFSEFSNTMNTTNFPPSDNALEKNLNTTMKLNIINKMTTDEPCTPSDPLPEAEKESAGPSGSFQEVTSAECRPRTLPFCDEVATYNATYLPNLAGAISETEKWQLAYYYNSIIDWSCNMWLKEYMCYILEPICIDDIAVPPCNGLCRVAKKGCAQYISSSPSLKSVFQCDLYPKASAQIVCAGLGNGEPCRETEFRCSDGTCIPATWRCDGESDCELDDDENQCQHHSGIL